MKPDTANLLDVKIKKLPKPTVRDKTYLEIMGASKRETIIANLLAFYFDPKEKHGFGDLFLRSFLKTKCYELDKNKEWKSLAEISEITKKLDTASTKVHLEQTADKSKRIDIVIETEQLIIAIEFKINHLLDNPLSNYRKYIEDTYPGKKKCYIVLTPYWKKPTAKYTSYASEFKQMILSHLISNVKKNLTEHTLALSNPYFLYLIDFIKTIENRRNNEENRKLILKHAIHEIDPLLLQKEAKEWYDLLDDFKKEIENKLNKLRKLTGGKIQGKNAFNRFVQKEGYDQSSRVLKIRLSLHGWQIELWTSKDDSVGKIVMPATGCFSYSTSPTTLAEKVSEFEKEHKLTNIPDIKSEVRDNIAPPA